MDYEMVKANSFGRSLKGVGLNLLVRDVRARCALIETVFDMTAFQISADFAILGYGDQVFQVHADGTYHSNPLLRVLPETPPRGAGIEIRLYDSDPDLCAARAEAVGATILQLPTDKPHGLREAYILYENGYVWVPGRPLTQGDAL